MDVIEYLRKRGLAQVDIARMLGVSEGFISLVKSRERGLTLDHMERLAQELSMPLGALFLVATEPPGDWNGSPEAKRLLARLAKIVRQTDMASEAIVRHMEASAPR